MHVALLALMLQLALAFGHHHFAEAQGADRVAAAIHAAEHEDGSDHGHDHSGPAHRHVCFDCLTATATGFAATAPAPLARPLRAAASAPPRHTTAAPIHIRAGFRSRAPPTAAFVA